ncbi:hypothetical protein [Chlorobaculum limnaeum]|uniref:hypothetical protein n=1 Tax=Chlorobaculum limnaeum TaxID=274537 RepID=UPI001969E084|nr:hypothetical protein [Chlorobaculum limnaeum]
MTPKRWQREEDAEDDVLVQPGGSGESAELWNAAEAGGFSPVECGGIVCWG